MSGLAGAGYAASMLVATAGLIALSRGGGGDADDDGSGGEEEEEEEAGVEVMVDQGAAATMKAVDQTALPLGTAAMSPAARASMLTAPLMGGDGLGERGGGDGLGGGGSAGLSLDAQLGAMDSPEDRHSSTCSSIGVDDSPPYPHPSSRDSARDSARDNVRDTLPPMRPRRRSSMSLATRGKRNSSARLPAPFGMGPLVAVLETREIGGIGADLLGGSGVQRTRSASTFAESSYSPERGGVRGSTSFPATAPTRQRSKSTYA